MSLSNQSRSFIAHASCLLTLTTLSGCAALLAGVMPKPAAPPAPADEGILGPLHAAHRGEIVFASEEIPRNGDTTVALQQEFRADERVFARVFLNQSIARQIASAPDPQQSCKWSNRRRIALFASVDGGEEMMLEGHGAGDKSWNSYTSMAPQTYDGPLVPQGPVALPDDSLKEKLLLLLANLPAGSHKVVLIQKADCAANPTIVLAKGELTMITDAKTRATLAKRLKLYDAKMKQSPDRARLKAAAQATFQNARVLEFRILETAWEINRDALNQPLSRDLRAATVYKKGGVCSLIGSKILETYEGGGRYGEPQFLNENDSRSKEKVVPCELASSR